MTPTGPLSGIRVLDLTSVLFGPYAAQMLGDWGADVIKVEPPAGDTWRYTGVFRNRGMSGQFMAVNRNKRSLALDLKHPDGKAALAKLIPTVDALVTNVRPAAMARLGFGYEACAKLNPRLIYAAATGFGQDGPWAARPAFDEIIQAASGLASSIGSDEEPEFVPSLIGDKICAMAMVGAVSAALFRRERSGQGQMVEVPMLETIAGFNSIEMLGGHAFDPPIGPTGYKRMKNRRPVQTKDGWLTMLPYSGDNWCAFFEAVGRPELIEELGVRDPVLRSQNIDKVYDRMSEIGPTRTTAEWEEIAAAAGRAAHRLRPAHRDRRAAASRRRRTVCGYRSSDRRPNPAGAARDEILGKPGRHPSHGAAPRRAFARGVARGGPERCGNPGGGRQQGGRGRVLSRPAFGNRISVMTVTSCCRGRV